ATTLRWTKVARRVCLGQPQPFRRIPGRDQSAVLELPGQVARLLDHLLRGRDIGAAGGMNSAAAHLKMGKETVLPPPPPLRTRRDSFESSGSSTYHRSGCPNGANRTRFRCLWERTSAGRPRAKSGRGIRQGGRLGGGRGRSAGAPDAGDDERVAKPRVLMKPVRATLALTSALAARLV